MPLDFSACSVAGLEFAIRFASRWDAQLVLFNAVPIRAFVPYGDYGGRELPDITGYAQDAAKQEMEDLISKLRTRGIKVENWAAPPKKFATTLASKALILSLLQRTAALASGMW